MFKAFFAALKQIFAANPELLKEIEKQESLLPADQDAPANRSSNQNQNAQPAPDDSAEGLKQLVAKLSDDNKKLYEILSEREKKEKEREKTIMEQSKKELLAKIDKEIEAATSDGRIAPKNAELIKTYKDWFEKDFDSTKKIVDSLPKSISQTPQAGKPASDLSAITTGLGSNLKPEFAKYVSTINQTTTNQNS